MKLASMCLSCHGMDGEHRDWCKWSPLPEPWMDRVDHCKHCRHRGRKCLECACHRNWRPQGMELFAR